jgi:hypothetical protein
LGFVFCVFHGLPFAFWKKKDSHGDGLREFLLEIPARRIAIVREERVDAGCGLLGLKRIYGEFCSVAFFVDGQDAESGDCFEGIVELLVNHAYTDRSAVANIDERGRGDSSDDDAPD